MADILIKGMKMPLRCEDCNFCEDISGYGCSVNHLVILRRHGQDKPSWCPLIRVQESGRVNVMGKWETIWQTYRMDGDHD